MLVLDASAVLDLLLRTPKADRVERRILQARGNLHVPQLLTLEVALVLRRYVTQGMPIERATEVLRDLGDLPAYRHVDNAIIGRIWQLSDFMTLHDASYVGLAEFLDAPLLTCDRHMASAAGHMVHVELI